MNHQGTLWTALPEGETANRAIRRWDLSSLVYWVLRRSTHLCEPRNEPARSRGAMAIGQWETVAHASRGPCHSATYFFKVDVLLFRLQHPPIAQNVALTQLLLRGSLESSCHLADDSAWNHCLNRRPSDDTCRILRATFKGVSERPWRRRSPVVTFDCLWPR